jgi:hypothetical protein
MQPLIVETVCFGPELRIPVATVTEVHGAVRRMKITGLLYRMQYLLN